MADLLKLTFLTLPANDVCCGEAPPPLVDIAPVNDFGEEPARYQSAVESAEANSDGLGNVEVRGELAFGWSHTSRRVNGASRRDERAGRREERGSGKHARCCGLGAVNI